MPTTEIATVDDSSLDLLPAAQPPSLAARQMLHAHAEMMQTAYELASKMCNTNLVPTRFRGKAEDGTAAILYGAELGLNPIQSLQRIVPIHGMPTLEARTMVALVQSRGYKVKTKAQSDESVTVWGRDLDGDEYESTWTIERAIRAGYVPKIDERTGKYETNVNGKLKGNEKYLTDPQAMLKAKAQAEVCRDMAPEVLLGISYTSEEMESESFDDRPVPQSSQPRSEPITVEEIFGETEPDPATETAPPTITEPIPERAQAVADAQAKLDADDKPEPASENRPEPENEQVNEAAQVDESAAPDAPDALATAQQNRQMHALFRDLDIKDRGDRLTITGAILGFKLDSSAGITSTEADAIITALKLWKAGRDADGNEIDAQDDIREILNRASLAESESTSPATEEKEG